MTGEDRRRAERPAGRVLGLDLGDARIGVAISDEAGRVAVPFGTIRAGAPQDVRALAGIVREQGVAAIVLGHPISLSGTAGPAAHAAETFAGVLREALGVPVTLHDERLSTVEASRALRDAGITGQRARRAVDSSAATVILQAYLDSAPRPNGSEQPRG